MIGNDRKIVVGAGIAIALAICCLGSLGASFFLFSDQSLALFGAASPTAPRSIRRTAAPTEETPFAIFVGDATVTASSTNTLTGSSKPTSTRTSTVGSGTPSKSPAACPRGCISQPSGCVVKGNIFEGQKLYLLPSSRYYNQATIDP